MTTFELTNADFLYSLMSKRIGITRQNLACLGLTWPPPKKWRERLTRAPFDLSTAGAKVIGDYYRAKYQGPPTLEMLKEETGVIHTSSRDPHRTHIFTDGGCVPNPGRGGWSAIIQPPGATEIILTGGERGTTNNRMELAGPINALLRARSDGLDKVTLFSDSQYVVDCMNSWVWTWERHGYRKPKKNLDMIQNLHAIQKTLDVKWRWVRGHNGHPENERCDQLAEEARRRV